MTDTTTDPEAQPDDDPLVIVRFEAANVKRLSAVRVEPSPEGGLVIVGGDNGQGKTSALDAVAMALDGKAGKDTPRPIRDGEKRAEVELHLGNADGTRYVVRRRWTSNTNNRLTVTTEDGAELPAPAELLKSMVGNLSFNPLDFIQARERDQVATLIELIDLPFDPFELDAERQRLYEERTDVGREQRRAEGAAAEAPPAPKLDNPERIDTTALVAEVEAARKRAAHAVELEREWQAVEETIATEAERLEELRAEVAACEARIAEAHERSASLLAAKAELPPAEPDRDLAAELTAALAHNQEVDEAERLRANRNRLDRAAQDARHRYENLTDQIDDIDKRKAEALADTTMPIAGLGFDADGVTYQGVPLKQCSGAEQLRVAIAIAMAGQPRIRVMRITDGSLLDAANLEVVREMARTHGFQVWIERVGNLDEGAVVIHDGAIVDEEES